MKIDNESSGNFHQINRPAAADMYCGCGAVTLGLKNSGFDVLSAIDNDRIACRTYSANHPEVRLFPDDIVDIEPSSFAEVLNGRSLDLLVVCAPCQPFSSQNRNRHKDGREELILQAARFARAIQPRIIFFENVPGLVSPANAGIMETLRGELAGAGYQLGEPVRVDAADYGVPQRRLRCIMFASMGGKVPELPAPVTPPGNRMTVAKAIGDLPVISSGQVSLADPLHFARQHRCVALERMKHIQKDGGDRFSLPPELYLNCHKGHKGHPDVYGRMKWADVAPTLTTGCTDITRGRFMHPRDDRAISCVKLRGCKPSRIHMPFQAPQKISLFKSETRSPSDSRR